MSQSTVISADEASFLNLDFVEGARGVTEGALSASQEGGGGIESGGGGGGGVGVGSVHLSGEDGALGIPEAAEAPFNGGEGLDAEELYVIGGAEMVKEGLEKGLEGLVVLGGEADGLGGGAVGDEGAGELAGGGGLRAAAEEDPVAAGGGSLLGSALPTFLHGWSSPFARRSSTMGVAIRTWVLVSD